MARGGIAAAVALAAAACGGARPVPRSDARIQLVACAPALPAPSLITWSAQTKGEPFELVGNGWSRRELPRPQATSPVVIGEITSPNVRSAVLEPVRSALQAKVPALTACFRQGLQPGLTLKAVVTWTLRIDRTGRVVDFSPRDLGLGSAYQACIAPVIESIQIPATPTMVMARVPINFDSQGFLAPAAPARATDPAARDPWTPFAAQDANPEGVEGIARAAEGAVGARLAALEACFAKASPAGRTGSLRALFELSADGTVLALRAGGLGDRAVEACVESALLSLTVLGPVQRAAEIQCDLARGEAEPWQVSPEGGYDIVTVSRRKLMHGPDELVAQGADPPPLDPTLAALLVLERDAPGSLVELALAWLTRADAALVTLAGAPGAAPRFLAMGRTGAVEAGMHRDPSLTFPMLRVGARAVTACLGRAAQSAPLSDPTAISTLASKLAAKCKTTGCSGTLLLALDHDAVAGSLLEVTAAARRAGFDRLLFGPDPDCQTPR